MPEAKQLISGDALKAAALRYSGDMRTRIQNDQGGLLSIFDGWFTRVVARLLQFDPARFWEDSVRDYAAQSPRRATTWNGTLCGCGYFSIAGSRVVSSNSPSGNAAPPSTSRGSAPNSASTCS